MMSTSQAQSAMRCSKGAGAAVDAALGAEIRGVDLKHLDDETCASIHAAWLQNILVFFAVDAGPSAHLRKILVRRFGTPVLRDLHQRNLGERTANDC